MRELRGEVGSEAMRAACGVKDRDQSTMPPDNCQYFRVEKKRKLCLCVI